MLSLDHISENSADGILDAILSLPAEANSAFQVRYRDSSELEISKQQPSKLARKAVSRFPRNAVRILEQWLVDHRDTPYATHQEQDELKAKTGLKRSQIMNWFANARKRGRLQALQSQTPRNRAEQAQSEHFLFSEVSSLHPFIRWLSQGPESEVASLSAIQQGIEARGGTGADEPNLPNCWLFYDQSPEASANWQYYRKACSSVSSMEIRSYAANVKSVCSDEWPEPDGPAPVLTRASRRHRRKGITTANRSGGHDLDPERKFQCTFCDERFKKKHDWQRHENSQHLPLERWICCSRDSVSVDPITNAISCVFCGLFDPDEEHIRGHGYTDCTNRPVFERTFYRKDHLGQHLKLMHFNNPLRPAMEEWRQTMTSIRSRCGFCNSEMETWEDRVQHLAEHFRHGAMMKDWRGDWGFEKNTLAVLQRAKLPERCSEAKQDGVISLIYEPQIEGWSMLAADSCATADAPGELMRSVPNVHSQEYDLRLYELDCANSGRIFREQSGVAKTRVLSSIPVVTGSYDGDSMAGLEWNVPSLSGTYEESSVASLEAQSQFDMAGFDVFEWQKQEHFQAGQHFEGGTYLFGS